MPMGPLTTGSSGSPTRNVIPTNAARGPATPRGEHFRLDGLDLLLRPPGGEAPRRSPAPNRRRPPAFWRMKFIDVPANLRYEFAALVVVPVPEAVHDHRLGERTRPRAVEALVETGRPYRVPRRTPAGGRSVRCSNGTTRAPAQPNCSPEKHPMTNDGGATGRPVDARRRAVRVAPERIRIADRVGEPLHPPGASPGRCSPSGRCAAPCPQGHASARASPRPVPACAIRARRPASSVMCFPPPNIRCGCRFEPRHLHHPRPRSRTSAASSRRPGRTASGSGRTSDRRGGSAFVRRQARSGEDRLGRTLSGVRTPGDRPARATRRAAR